MLTIAACLVLSVQVGYGDERHLKNGDRLTGKIVQLVDGKLLFKSDVTPAIGAHSTDVKYFLGLGYRF